MIPSAWLVGCMTGSRKRLAATTSLWMSTTSRPGSTFVTHLNSQVAPCEVVLVMIGPNWLTAKDKAGQRRSHKPRTCRDRNSSGACPRHSCHPGSSRRGTHAEGERASRWLKPLARRQAVECATRILARTLKRSSKECARHSVTRRWSQTSAKHPRETGRWRVRPMLKKHLISTVIGLVIGFLVSAWLQPLTSEGVSILLFTYCCGCECGRNS